MTAATEPARPPLDAAGPVLAAGGVVRREGVRGPEYLVVHRPRYDDWSLPKGKLQPGEAHLPGALREVEEETGLHCDPSLELPGTAYRDPLGRAKTVRYWLMAPKMGAFSPNREVDEVRWLYAEGAEALLSYAHDRMVLEAAAGLEAPIYLVRHAKAGDRGAWSEDDRVRPLTKKGRRQAEGLVDLLAGAGIARILSSPYLRCVQTARPLALALGLPVEEMAILGEGRPCAPVRRLMESLHAPAVLCSHGDLVPMLVQEILAEGVEVSEAGDWKKGSTWILERRAGVVSRARYLPPPPGA
jgi:8-oxo-dGTP diphosphatase